MHRHVEVLRRVVRTAPVFFILLLLGVQVVHAQSSVSVELQDRKHAGLFAVPLNKSQIFRVDVPYKELFIGNEEIADVLPLTDRTVYVLGKSLGSTNLAIYGKKKSLIAVVDLVVSFDIEGLKRSLFDHELKNVQVRAANGSVILSGMVNSSEQLARTLAIAKRYASDKVTNLLQVQGSQQVLLEVRFAEVQRTALKQIGLNAQAVFGDGTTTFSVLTGNTLIPNAFVSTLTNTVMGNWTLSTLFDALEEKQVLKTLAEPNLVALSGETASFLAGGEFPVPVTQSGDTGGAAITVEFKQFGVSLAFTPTVLEDNLISLVVNPEVSTIDRTNAITLVADAPPIPGLSTRRATTTIELRDGQSFAIAGLIQNNFTDTIRQFPWLGDIPILGALMRSSDFEREETELVILVTPRLVSPSSAGTLATPADTFVPPSDLDLFLMGRMEAPESGHPGAATELLVQQGAGGLTGSYGHIVK